MAFEKRVPQWHAPGTEPPESLITNGFTGGFQPPADFFNWFWHGVSEALLELQGMKPEDIGAAAGSHSHNSSDISGLSDALTWMLSKKMTNIEAGGNLDDCTAVGLYTYSAANSSSITNAPEQAQATVLVLPRLINDNTSNLVQVVYTTSNSIYVRNRSDNTWNGWRKFFKDDDVIPISHGGTGGRTSEQARANLGVAAADHGRHVPKTCVTVEDWNNAKETGWYMGNNAANGPTTTDGGTVWYFGYVIAHNVNYVFQELYQFSASNDAKSIPKFIRACKEGVWGGWTKVTVQRDVPYDAKLDYIKTLTGDAQEQINNRMYQRPSIIEMNPATDANHGGYIDFHYNGTEEDFTSRIIEEAEGCLRFISKNGSKVNTIDPAKDAIRNIQAGTTDMVAGTSTLATGAIFLVYEEGDS